MPEGQPIDFADLARALLERAETLVPQWLSGGSRKGSEWVCADLTGGSGGSCSVNLVTGVWADFSGDERGGDLISLYAAIHGLNQGQAARQLMAELGWQQPARSRPSGGAARPQPPANDRPEPPLEAYEADASPVVSAQRRRSLWRAIVPVPAHAPPADFRHWHYTQVAGSWEYRFAGQLYGHVVRFATSDGGKEILPHTWCVDESDARGTQRWHWKQWDEPRPLYVPATLLSGTPADVPVVLVEGEKCALAGHELLGHEFDFVSWPGGSNAWAKANWGWLLGRTVYLWPDADAKRARLTPQERKDGVDPATKPLLPERMQPGMKAMVAIGSLLAADKACTVLMCPVPKPENVATDGWDIADAIAGGWTAEDVRAFIRGAHVFVPPDDAARAKQGARAAEERQTPSMAGAGTSGEAASDAWREALLKTEKGSIKAVRENIVLAIDGLPGQGVPGVPDVRGVIGWNEFTNDVVKLRPSPWGTPAGVWREEDDLLMGEWLVREHWLPSMARQTLEEATRMVACRHTFHPVREYLQGLKWDGQQRLRTWVRVACLEPDEWDDAHPLQQYLARAGTYYLMGMCQRVLNPGCKFDYMLVLESPQQGRGKSSLFRVLGGEYFADTGVVLGDKDSYQQLQGRWMYEMGELDAMGKAEITKVKLYIASQSDYFRASFDRRARDYPRQVVFGGTTNDDQYLIDSSGNRRFWPVRVTRQVDLDWLRENRDQLFAEAVARLAAGKRWYPLPDEEKRLFVPQQEARRAVGAIEAAITAYLYDETQKVGLSGENGSMVNEISANELLQRVGFTLDKQTDLVHKRATAALRRLGWEHRKSSKPGRPWVYRRPRDDDKGLASASDGSRGGHDAGRQPVGAEDACPF